jgi:hypothetical protein
VHYRIHPDLPFWTQAVLRETQAGLCGSKPFVKDGIALKEMSDRRVPSVALDLAG